MSDDRLTTIRARLHRPRLLRAWQAVDDETKHAVLAELEETARSLSDADRRLATGLVVAADLLEVLATEAGTQEPTALDAEWLLGQLDEARARR